MNSLLISNGRVIDPASGTDLVGDLLIIDGKVSALGKDVRAKAPKKIRPRVSPSLHDVADRFLASQDEIRRFIRLYHGIDLAGTTFPNPFIKGVRFSLATGLHVLAAHERRHLWQAWRVREAATSAAG